MISGENTIFVSAIRKQMGALVNDVPELSTEDVTGLPKKQPEGVRKSKRLENVVPLKSQELQNDIESLTATELRKKYRCEANSHRNGKSRCKSSAYIWDPSLNSFKDFLFHVGPCPGKGYTLDRIDPSDPEYAPGKVRWASKAAQTHNRRNTKYLTDSAGLTLSMSEWGRRSGIPAKTIGERVDRHGWSVDEATTVPVGGKRPRPSVTSLPGKSPPHHSSATPLVSIWKQLLADVHLHQFCSFTAADKKMIKDVANRFESAGLSATEVLVTVLTDWRQFTEFARYKYGAFG